MCSEDLASFVCLVASALLGRTVGLCSGGQRAEAFAAIRRAATELHHRTAFDACKLAAALEQS